LAATVAIVAIGEGPPAMFDKLDNRARPPKPLEGRLKSGILAQRSKAF
jgi:hypothetical protein